MPDPRLLDLGLLPRRRSLLVELIPGGLPTLHRRFGFGHPHGIILIRRRGQLQLRLGALKFAAQVAQQGLILRQMALRLLPGLLGLLQVIAHLALAVAVELQHLFDATDIRANTVVARLRLVEAVVQLAMLIALLLDFAIGIALLGNYPFQRYFEATHLLFTLQRLTIQRLPTQRLQLRLELTLISLERLVLLRRLGLAMQAG